MKIAIYGRPFQPGYEPGAESPSPIHGEVKGIFAQLDALGIDYIIHKTYYESFRALGIDFNKAYATFNSELTNNSVDYLISIGGDGTLLESLLYVAKAGIPILGINTGKLGFLSLVPKDNIAPAIRAIKEGTFTIQNRSLLRLETPPAQAGLFGKNNYALNEVCIRRKDSSTMIRIDAWVNGEFLNTYWADGLIVATPTGSTAYSLSCSGLILLPEDSSFIITPIAPHNLNVRPVVIPDNSVITLKVESRIPSYLVSLDSRSQTIDSSEELVIGKENFTVKLIQIPGHSFAETLRKKLNWGKDVRNE